MKIISANQAIKVLGGTVAVAKLFGIDYRVVSNWRHRGLPPDAHHVMGAALLDDGHEFSPLLFAQKLPATEARRFRRKRKPAAAAAPAP